ncbi:MAG TPA: PEP/pyruvate-binding domain-containing protein [Mycobacteriales bacterium]|nr:PEP/pyruvate-binding domain-containing protein [Mycobacteriales bacterium]
MTGVVVAGVVPLMEATDETQYGAKAVGLGTALRAGLPVPPGVALSGSFVDQVAASDPDAWSALSSSALSSSVSSLPVPLAVRSSCVDEDSAAASFAGQHLTVLNVPTAAGVADAVREIWWSANSDSAITYRKRLGVFTRPSVGVVVQSLLSPESAGVMFTRNPINGADERMIEAAWGHGEAVVAGRVIPDTFRLSRSGEVLDRRPGLKKFAIRPVNTGGTVDEDVAPELVEALCLSDRQLALLGELASACERVYGDGRDIEWAFADGELYLLQCRAVTVSAGASTSVSVPAQVDPDQVETLGRVPLFESLSETDRAKIAGLFKQRTFAAGETVAKEGSDAAAFYLIDSGTATVTVHGAFRRTLGPGDHFGEIALLDQGARSATVTADSELICQGITLWDFQPLVQSNPAIAWTLLQTLARMLRATT